MGGVTYEQLMKPLQILKLVRKLHEAGQFFQTLMRMGPNTPPSIISAHRTFGYDTYASTRTTAPITAPGAPPARMGLKPVGQNTATLVRMHGSIPIYDEKVFMSRPVGGRLSQVDPTGRRYVRLQLEHMVKSFRNSREFMVSRMLRGGFSLVESGGDQFRLAELNDANADISINYNIPGDNLADGGVIAAGESWNLTGAPIHKHFMLLDKKMARTSGYSPRHCILNSTTMEPLFRNTVLQGIGGSVFRIFDSFTKKEISPEDPRTSAWYTVVFRGMPHIQFHVLNEGLITDEVVPDEASQILESNFKLFVPDGKAIIIPEPDGIWSGYAAGMEPVRERVDQINPRVIQGFGVWRTPEIDPARYEVKALDNGIPLLFMPRVVHFLDVWEPFTSSEA